jgi:hypothetical protein
MESASWEADNRDTPLKDWVYIDGSIYKHRYIKILLELKDWPIIGDFAGNMVFNHIS